jgi:uncharacterized protein YxjI
VGVAERRTKCAREKAFAFGDDYWVENDAGERAFKVDGKVLGLRNTFVLEDHD